MQISETDNTMQAANDFETSIVVQRERSERRAWIVASAACLIAALEAVAIVSIMPLKETEPYVIRVDSVTGVPDIVTAMEDSKITGDEALDKYFLAKYVRARETYDWYTLQSDYDAVGLLSSPDVARDYSALFDGEDALDKRYGSRIRATVEILSVVPTSKNTGAIRFLKRTKRVGATGDGDVTKWVATVAYEYRDASRITESVRMVNPFGFQVTSWRVDPELAGSDEE